MEDINRLIVSVSKEEIPTSTLVTLLELCTDRLDIDTISEMARKEGKSPNGIKVSNQYRKLKIGKQVFAIKGIRHRNWPF